MTVELAHDIIALKIWEQLPEQDKQLRLIQTSLEQRLKDYEKGAGSYLGEKELLAWEDYLPFLRLTEAQKNFIENSRRAVEQNKLEEQEQKNRELQLVQQKLAVERRSRKRQRLFLAALSLLTIASIVASIWAVKNGRTAVMSAKIAEEKQIEAENSAKEMSLVVQNLAQKRCEELFVSIDNSLENYDFKQAIIKAEAIKTVLDDNQQKIEAVTDNQSIIDDFEKVIQPLAQKAGDYITKYQGLATDGSGAAYMDLMRKINQAVRQKAFSQALQHHQVAEQLNIPMMAQELKDKRTTIYNQAFNYYFTTAKNGFDKNRSKRAKYIDPHAAIKNAKFYATIGQKEQLNNWFKQTYCIDLLSNYPSDNYPQMQEIINLCNQ